MRKIFFYLCILIPTITYSQEIQWTSFVWYSDTLSGTVRPKLAILIPCMLKGNPRKLLLQLDSGADGSSIQEGPRRQFHLPITWADSEYAFTTVSATLGSYHIDSIRFAITRDAKDTLQENDPYPNIGTLGEDFLVGKVLILDFPHNRFAIFDSMNRLPDEFLSRVSFTSLNRRNNKLFVTIQLGDTASSNFFFDSGSSMFPIITTKQLWKRLTGLQGNESSLLRAKVASWGKDVIEVGAPIKGGVRLGILTVPNAIAYFDSTRDEFASYPFKTDGLIGNALLYDDYTVVIDLVKNRFGILRE